MKQNLLFLAVSIFSVAVMNAQISKGSILLGGNIGFSDSKDKNNSDIKLNSVSLSPAIGVAVEQNAIVGIQISYGHSKNNLAASPQYETTSYGLEFFLRKYKSLGKGFYFFWQSGLFYNSYEYRELNTSNEYKEEQRNAGIDLYPGISYALAKRFQLEISLVDLLTLEYTKDKATNAGVVTGDRNGVDFNVAASSLSNVNIGFRFLLAK
ncbi:MAG: hypothetical protein ACHQF0_04600 [Chitinophagales bacterium]